MITVTGNITDNITVITGNITGALIALDASEGWVAESSALSHA